MIPVQKEKGRRRILPLVVAGLSACYLHTLASTASAEPWDIKGFADTVNHYRDDVGLTKSRFTGQLEFSKAFESRGIFSEFSFNSTLRASYDAVYDWNDDEFGNEAGGPLTFAAPGNPAFLGSLPGAPPFAPGISTNPEYAGILPPPPIGPGTGAVPLPGVPGGTLFSPNNPNDGLRYAAGDIYGYKDGGVILATPVRPCDEDKRGCGLDDYMDKDEDELKSKEIFSDDWDWLREFYLNAAIPFANGDELAISLGRQQVVWGRTDLFRVLDVVNPMDFSRHKIFDEFEDIRIPQGILNTEYRFGATETFEDINLQFLWKWEKPRPHDLGQGGEPYAILGAGNFFRAMNNCWENGCTVGNFPATGLAVDFPEQAIGIRDVDTKDWGDYEYGARLEGVYKGVGFSFNVLSYYSQFPSLRGGIQSINPFIPAGAPNDPAVYDYALAFDIKFPRLLMYGGSADWYMDSIKTAFRVEVSLTEDEEFADTSVPELYSESDVFRWVLGFDRPTFIPFLNKRRAFLISAQVFGEHLLDHETSRVNSIGIPTLDDIGFQNWDDNYFFTLLFQGNYMSDRLTPQILAAYDVEADALVIAPGIDWKPSNNWRVIFNYNVKVGDGAIKADDNRGANPYPPASCAPGLPAEACFQSFSSLGVTGFEPLGRFRSGPIGTAIREDELQLTIRYQF